MKHALKNPNHPKKGARIKADPVRNIDDIARIKLYLSDKPRDLCLFTFGINTAYRASELLSITVGDVMYLRAGDVLDLKQIKTQKYRMTTINQTVIDSIQNWLKHHPNPVPDAPLFQSQRGKKALTVSTLSRYTKHWCKAIKLPGNYSSHTMRKTWGYLQRTIYKVSVSLLMKAYGHASEQQTLEYLCIQPEEISALYEHAF